MRGIRDFRKRRDELLLCAHEILDLILQYVVERVESHANPFLGVVTFVQQACRPTSSCGLWPSPLCGPRPSSERWYRLAMTTISTTPSPSSCHRGSRTPMNWRSVPSAPSTCPCP